MYTGAPEAGLVYNIANYSNVYLNESNFVGSISSVTLFNNILELVLRAFFPMKS